jgi:hypothetical protein
MSYLRLPIVLAKKLLARMNTVSLSPSWMSIRNLILNKKHLALAVKDLRYDMDTDKCHIDFKYLWCWIIFVFGGIFLSDRPLSPIICFIDFRISNTGTSPPSGEGACLLGFRWSNSLNSCCILHSENFITLVLYWFALHIKNYSSAVTLLIVKSYN